VTMTDHTPTPWHRVIHDSSMASIEGPKEELDHVLSVSPCKNCRGEHWQWGACTNPKEADAAFIVKAVNNHDALVEHLRRLAVPACDEAALALIESVTAVVGSPAP
jgi:hypothetical protein